MSEQSAQTWLRNHVVTSPATYALKGVGYAGPTMKTAVGTFFTNLNNGLAALSNERTAMDAEYSFMSADNVINAAKDHGFGFDPAYFLYDLFNAVSGKCGHSLTRYDLWHGHFVDMGQSGVGIVFHAKEQPADIQTDAVDNSKSPFRSTDAAFNGRNVLWFAASNRFYALDTGNGSAVLTNYVSDRVAGWDEEFKAAVIATRTVFEDDLGTPLGFVYYRCNLGYCHWKSTFISIKPQIG